MPQVVNKLHNFLNGLLIITDEINYFRHGRREKNQDPEDRDFKFRLSKS